MIDELPWWVSGKSVGLSICRPEFKFHRHQEECSQVMLLLSVILTVIFPPVNCKVKYNLKDVSFSGCLEHPLPPRLHWGVYISRGLGNSNNFLGRACGSGLAFYVMISFCSRNDSRCTGTSFPYLLLHLFIFVYRYFFLI